MPVAPAGSGAGPVVAVGGVAVVERRLLLVQRANPPQAGRWTVPGGRVEPGEALAAAVEREVREETGVVVRCGPMLGWVERIGPDHHFVILDFVVDVPSDAPAPVAGDDAAAVAWVALAEVPAVALVDGLEEFLRAHGVLD
ncbi:MAG TPA: NUDIX domain-containing protein [Acidimicrobiales bacterium]|nr:NUDIX domain-containing protein [Acidimicrobiales bacterium]